MRKFLTFFLTALLAFGVGWAGEVTDVIDYSVSLPHLQNIGSTNWQSFNVTGQSGAEYVIRSMGFYKSSGSITGYAIRWSSGANSYMYTTKSPGTLKSIKLYGASSDGKSVNIFARNDEFPSAPDAGTSPSGVLTTLKYLNDGNEYVFNSTYAYLGMSGRSSSTQIEKVEITWEIEGGDTPTLSSSTSTLTLKEPNGSFTVTGTNLVDNVGVNQNPDGLFNLSFSGDNSKPWGFERDGENKVNGTVTVSYQGRDLTATGTIIPGTKNADWTADIEAPVTVTYQPDLYIYCDLVDGNSWRYYPDEPQMTYANGVYTKTVTITNPGSCILFAKAAGLYYNWNDDRQFFGAKWDSDWVYGVDNSKYIANYGSGSSQGKNQYYPIKFNQTGVYTITIDPVAMEFTVTSTSVSNIAQAQAKPVDDTFTFMGSAVVTYQSGNNLWIRDASGSGLINGSVGVTFENGEILAPGWSAKNTMYNTYVPRFTNPANVAKGEGTAAAAPIPLDSLTVRDMNKYVSLSNVTVTAVSGRNYTVTIGDKQAHLYDYFQLFTQNPLVKDNKYNVEGVVTYYDGAPELYLTKVEEIKTLKVTLVSETTTAATGETIPVTVNVENAEGAYTVTYKIGNGTETTLTGNVINVTSATAGELTLYVTVTNNGNTATANETYTFHEPVQPGSNVFKKVTSLDELVAGQKYIFVHEGSTGAYPKAPSAMGAMDGSFGTPVAITVNADGTVTINDDVTVFTLGGTTNEYTFTFPDGTTVLGGTSGTGLSTTATGEIATWRINNYNNTLNGYRIVNASKTDRAIRRTTNNYDRYGHYSTGDNNSEYAWIYVQTASTPEPDPMTITLSEADPEGYTVGTDVTVTATVENGSENTDVTYKIGVGEGEYLNYPEGGIVLNSTTAGDVVVTVKATDGDNVVTAEETYHFNAADAFEISLNADPNEETYTVGETVKVTVAVENALVKNPTITYTISGENREATPYPAEGIEFTRKTAGDVVLTVNVSDGYEHEGASSKEATYTFVAANAIQVELDPAEKTYTIGDEAKVKVTITGTIGEYETAILINGEETERTIDENGYITLPNDKAGNVTLTVTVTDGYAHAEGGTATGTYTFNKKPAQLSFNDAEYTKYVGDLSFEGQEVNNPNELTVTYVASNDFVEVDDETGFVVLGDEPGDVTIYAISAETETFLPDTVSYVIHIIAKEVATLLFDKEGITVYPNAEAGEDFVQPKLTTDPEGLTVVYESTDDDIATVIEGVLVIGEKEGTATITAKFKGNTEYGEASASYTVTVEPRPIIVADDGVEFDELYVGETASKTFEVAGANLKGDITLTLTDETGFFSIDPITIAKPAEGAKAGEVNATVTVTYAPEAEGVHSATVTLSTPDALENVTVTLTGVAEVRPVVATPTFSKVSGSYGENIQVTIDCATEGATIRYTVNGETTEAAAPVTIDLNDDATIEAVAVVDGMTTSEVANAYYIIDIPAELPTITPFKGYYYIKNNENDMYANIAGRKTMNFVSNPDKAAGTVIWLETNDKGQVQSLRSQGADLQGYANRAMRYVPDLVQLVADKLHAEGAGEGILGANGLDEIMDKFNECFDYHLYVEQYGDSWRLYGKTPSMQPVVDFYREHTHQVEAKLPMLEDFINDALTKIRNKLGGQSVFTPFSVHQIWHRMDSALVDAELTEPVDSASTMEFYRQVLNNKNYVWSFAYETAQIYWGNVKSHPRYPELKSKLGEYADYLDEFVTHIRPDFKYYVIQRGNEPDYISEGNREINEPRSLWTIEGRDDFTVNFSITADNKAYYTTLYTDFAYYVPEGVTALKVLRVNDLGYMITEPLSGTIPAQTPVLLKSNAAGDKNLMLQTVGNADTTGNILVGADYFINEFEIKTQQVVDLFNIAQSILGETLYNNYLAQYEHLMALNSGTVNNRYFWGLSQVQVEECVDGKRCVIRSFGNGDKGLGFYDKWEAPANQAFLENTTFNPVKLTSKGDVTRDGVWDVNDVTATIALALGTQLDPITYDLDAADVNDDGEWDVTDVTGVIAIVLSDPVQQDDGE